MLFQHGPNNNDESAPSARLSELEIEAIDMFINFLRMLAYKNQSARYTGFFSFPQSPSPWTI